METVLGVMRKKCVLKLENGKDRGYKSEAPDCDDGDVKKLNDDATSCIREQADYSC